MFDKIDFKINEQFIRFCEETAAQYRKEAGQRPACSIIPLNRQRLQGMPNIMGVRQFQFSEQFPIRKFLTIESVSPTENWRVTGRLACIRCMTAYPGILCVKEKLILECYPGAFFLLFMEQVFQKAENISVAHDLYEAMLSYLVL